MFQNLNICTCTSYLESVIIEIYVFQPEDMEDLIRLDSTSDIDDFDPLKTNSYDSNAPAPLSLANPLYTYENHKTNGSLSNSRNDQDLLQEYGLDFKSFPSVQSHQQHFDPFASTSGGQKVSSPRQWTRFD